MTAGPLSSKTSSGTEWLTAGSHGVNLPSISCFKNWYNKHCINTKLSSSLWSFTWRSVRTTEEVDDEMKPKCNWGTFKQSTVEIEDTYCTAARDHRETKTVKPANVITDIHHSANKTVKSRTHAVSQANCAHQECSQLCQNVVGRLTANESDRWTHSQH